MMIHPLTPKLLDGADERFRRLEPEDHDPGTKAQALHPFLPIVSGLMSHLVLVGSSDL